MDSEAASFAVGFSWSAILLVWTITALRAKQAARVQAASGRIAHLAAIVAGFGLLFWPVPIRWLRVRFVPFAAPTFVTGGALTVVGAAVAIWARLYLGTNWSGSVTIKRDHTLVCSGPYRMARHPIYTGLLLATFGTALCGGEVRALVGFCIVFTTLLVKSRVEESFLLNEFGEDYRRYRGRVKALIPFVL